MSDCFLFTRIKKKKKTTTEFLLSADVSVASTVLAYKRLLSAPPTSRDSAQRCCLNEQKILCSEGSRH